ncbi:MAG: SGNH/GDSL hydrolase family protein [Planctomycetales bacterium]
MHWLVYHVASGQSFFSGIALLIVAAVFSLSSQRFRRLTFAAFACGFFAVLLSSAPTPQWYAALLVVVTLAWVASWFRQRGRRLTAWCMILLWLGAAVIELPNHFVPSLQLAPSRQITIIGDSVTAGTGGDDKSETWPRILGREHDLQIQDISQIGETAASALKRVQAQTIDSPLVIVEIGGNDVLGSTSPEKFARDLEKLLGHLSKENRQIVMFELPLPPFCQEYGRAQRRLAREYQVHLLPKRILLSVLGSFDATLDSIHLSQSGHQAMADRVWDVVGAAFDR